MKPEIIDALYNLNVVEFTPQNILDIKAVITNLNSGKLRVAEQQQDGNWLVHQWIKKSILLYLKLSANYLISNAPENSAWYDKVPNKFNNWQLEDFQQAKIRTVPNSYVRYGAYLAEDVIVMPSFINMGVYVDSGSMIDSFVTVGSCAQIGKKCHISADVCIGGVLEPLQANPVIVEDQCFIGAGAKILEGVIVKKGAVIAAGTVISATTKIINRETGDIVYGEVPEYSVVVPGSIMGKNNIALSAAVIVKQVDEKTKSKTSINELLRF